MEKYYIATVCAADKIGSQRTKILLNFFGSAEKVWKAERGDLEKSGLTPNALESFLHFRQENPNAPEKLIEFCETKKIGLCSIVDEDYPPILKQIPLPPAVFYYRGKLEPFAERIAMVGTRQYTRYGEKIAKNIAENLAAAGLTIVSGAANGIDTFSHKGALKNGRTVAVIASGINFKNPYEKQRLLDEIADNGGLVMTEFKPSMTPHVGNFPARNRIIAGLSKGVIVVEAGERSGAILTAGLAGDYGRDVFAVPGSLFSEKSFGCHKLIRDGAVLIRGADDVLEFYDFDTESKMKKILTSPPVVLDETEKKVFNLIPFEEDITADEILMQIDDIEPNELSEILLKLEVKKLITDSGDSYRKN